MAVILLLCVLTHPIGAKTIEVDVVEVNHVYYDDDECNFTQLILWRWVNVLPTPGHRVAQWQMVKHPDDVRVEIGNGNRTTVLVRGKHGRCYELSAYSYIETHTGYDREVWDRDRLPEKRRVPYFESQ